MRNRHSWRISETEYPSIRRVMGPERYRLDDAALEDRLTELFPGADPEDVENFMGAVQSFGNRLAPLARRALPGAIRGAAQGAMVAGPWGALAGAAGGGASGLFSRGPADRSAAAVPQPATTPPSTSGSEPVPAAGALASAPAAQLLALLSRPETLQALLSMLMSSAGRSAVQVGARSVPAAAFANAVSEIATEVTELATPSLSAPISDYLVDEYGSPRCDLANPRSRAELLLNDVAEFAESEAAEERYRWERNSREVSRRTIAETSFEAGDPIDSYEAALEGEEDYQ